MKKIISLLCIGLLLLANTSSAVIILDGNIPPGCTVSAGTLTCTGFVGDGSGLTGITADSNDTEITRLSVAEKTNSATPVSGTTGTFSGTVTATGGFSTPRQASDSVSGNKGQSAKWYEDVDDGDSQYTQSVTALDGNFTDTIEGSTRTSTLNLITTGTLQGDLNIVNKSDNATLATTEMRGSIVVVSAAKTMTLPAVEIGNSACVYSSGANIVEVRPNASDGFVLAGAARDTDGQGIYSDGTAGAFICFFGDSADGWTTLGSKGTWTSR